MRPIFLIGYMGCGKSTLGRMVSSLTGKDVIVACGGGTPCFFDNMDWMNAHGTTVFLDTSTDKLFARLKRGRHKRPLIADKTDDELREFIITALDGRMPHYSKAAIVFKSDLMESEKLATGRRFVEELNIH